MKIYLYRNNQEEIIKYKEKTRLNPDEWSHIIIHKNPDYESGKNILTKSETQQIVQICGIRNIKNKKLLVCTPELFMYHKSSNSHITALRLEFDIGLDEIINARRFVGTMYIDGYWF